LRPPAYAGKGPNANIGVALGGIIACGAVYTLIGVHRAGHRHGLDRALHAARGHRRSVVAVIGLNLAGIPIKNMAASNFDSWMQVVTFVSVGLVAVLTRGMVQRLLILVGLIVASIIYAVLTNGLGLGKPLDLSAVLAAPWVGMPGFSAPVFSGPAMLLIAPVAIILVAENLGHIKAVTAMTGKNLDQYMGRAFIGDGIATMVSGGAGGTGVTTYAENIGVMAATKIYSTAVFLVAALIAVVLGFSPKFGAVIQAIPLPVMGGVSIVVFGLIAVAGAKIWVDNKVDFSQNKNLIVAAITLVLGTGDFTLKFGQFALGGIGTATFGAIVLYALLQLGALGHLLAHGIAQALDRPIGRRGQRVLHLHGFEHQQRLALAHRVARLDPQIDDLARQRRAHHRVGRRRRLVLRNIERIDQAQAAALAIHEQRVVDAAVEGGTPHDRRREHVRAQPDRQSAVLETLDAGLTRTFRQFQPQAAVAQPLRDHDDFALAVLPAHFLMPRAGSRRGSRRRCAPRWRGRAAVRPAQRQRLAGGHAQLPLDQVLAGDGLGHRVLDLQPGVHLHEEEVADPLLRRR
jgi:uracil-xanthine permease